jgi:steroid delta-isomerase-like uncharacterized protein
MSVQQNKASIKRSTDELWNNGNLAIVPELVTPDFVFHTVMEVKGPEGYRQYVSMMRGAFPDWHETIDHLVAEGDMASVFYTIRGTFKNAFMGIPPTGKKFIINTVVLWCFEKGKVVEAWVYSDSLKLYQQLGISPPPG